MSQLHCLPQEMVFWGENILKSTLGKLQEYGIESPITFTIEPLEKLYRQFVLPNVTNKVGIYTDFPPHVPDIAVYAGLDECIRSKAKSIIAIGGGSVLDAAKAVSYLHFQKVGVFLPIVALPTTLSGSEFSHYFGITETTGPDNFKKSYAVRETVPKLVVIDPLLIVNTPRSLLLSSAIKSMDHAIEGMRKVEIDHPHAIMAASGVERYLKVLEKWPEEIETRDALDKGLVTHSDLLQLQLAAWQCYFSPASVIYGLSHRIGHILGGTFGLPHSVTSCITLAPVIEECASFYDPKLPNFVNAKDGVGAAVKLASEISHLVNKLGLPNRISAFDFHKSNLPKVADMLKTYYPDEVADLGYGASTKLDELLARLW